MQMSTKRAKMATIAKFTAATPAADSQFTDLEKQLKQFDEKRETVIKRSRDIQKAAKQAIYALQRGDISKANELLKVCEGQNDLFELVKGEPDLRYGSFAASLEEYAEAVIFKEYVANKTSATPLGMRSIPLELTAEEYLGGLMDCCGEVQRYAVFSATRGNVLEVERAREYVDYVMGRVMNFEFRNGSLRKKSDTIKWVLKRLEEVLFDISVSGRLSDDNQRAPPKEDGNDTEEMDASRGRT
jgi:predicted translin family RNA/ssDNA-binding protein